MLHAIYKNWDLLSRSFLQYCNFILLKKYEKVTEEVLKVEFYFSRTRARTPSNALNLTFWG